MSDAWSEEPGGLSPNVTSSHADPGSLWGAAGAALDGRSLCRVIPEETYFDG